MKLKFIKTDTDSGIWFDPSDISTVEEAVEYEKWETGDCVYVTMKSGKRFAVPDYTDSQFIEQLKLWEREG